MGGPAADGVIPPKQQRGHETLDRILDACDRMLAQRRFDEISTTDIYNEAEVSSSSLYARFESKDAILLALIDRHGERLQESIAFVGDRLAEQDPIDLPALVRALVAETVYFSHSYGHLEVAARAYPEARARLQEVNERPITWILQRTEGVVSGLSPSLRRRLEFATRAAAAVAHRAVGGNVCFADLMGMGDEEVIDEVTRMTLAYVDAALSLE